MLSLSSVLFFVYGIMTGSETDIPSDDLGDYLNLCGTITYSLNWYHKSPLTKELLPVII